jgi:signal transduction histidine kinase
MLDSAKINQLLAINSQRILAFTLLTLHALLISSENSVGLQQLFFICHFSLFLMWQPIWRNAEKVSIVSVVIFLLFCWIAFNYSHWWFIATWLSALFGLLGGRVFSDDSKTNRIIHIVAASYLLSMLLLWVVPKLIGASNDMEAAKFTITYFMPLLPVSIFFVARQDTLKGQLPILDFFYTLLITMIALILVLVSFAIGTLHRVNYIQIMFISVFGLATLIFAFSLLWKPSTRFSGIELMMSRYLLSIGMPFEQWVKNIANLGEIESNANTFLQGAMQEMNSLPWVTGVSWLTDSAQGKLGQSAEHSTHFNFRDLYITLHSRWQISPALYVHVKLLTQIMGEFYEAKRREEVMRQNAYMQAFYESGSRLTHDIKNILQSVGTLVSAAEQTDESDNERLVVLIRRQLPLLNQRIAATLDKLKAPSEEKKRLEKMAEWWKNLQLRHHQANIEFIAESLPALEINAEVLDSVVDNLLSNAIEKAKYQPDVRIKAEILNDVIDGYCIDVTDTGKPIDKEVKNHLFKKHVSSNSGMGVGLYHAALDAQQAGYALCIASNVKGAVSFRVKLSP